MDKDVTVKLLDTIRVLAVIAVVIAVGMGLLNLDAVVTFAGKMIDLLKTLR